MTFRILLISILLSGCSQESLTSGTFQPPATASAGPATFSQVNTNIIQTTCIRCHSSANPGGPAGGNDFSTYEGVMKQVVADNPDQSNFYVQVQTGRMPLGGPKLPDDQIQLIRDWITAGATNN